MREDLAALADRGAGAEPPPELVNALFRSAHTLKGLAGLFGLEAIAELAHQLEDLLGSLRLGRARLGATTLERIERAVQHFTELLGCVGHRAALASLGDASARLAAELASAAASPPEARASDAPAAAADPDLAQALDLDRRVLAALTEYEEHRLRESLRRGRRILLVESTFEILSFEQGLAEL